MISQNKKIYKSTCCTLVLVASSVAYFDKKALAEEIHTSCSEIEFISSYPLPAVTSLTLGNTQDLNDIVPSIVVTNRKTLVSPNEKIATLVITGPRFTSADSELFETKLICNKKGFNIVSKITRSAAFNGVLMRNIPWRPRTVVTFKFQRSQVVVKAMWKMILETGIEIDRDIANPKQNFPTTVTKVIR